MSRCSFPVCPIILMWACSMSSGMEVPRWRFLMIHIYLQWQELAWDSKSSSMRFGYSYFTGHEVFNLWFVKHMHHKFIRINFNHSRCLWWGQWELKANKYHNFWRFIKLAITASLREEPFFYFYVESPPSIFMHRLREHSCHSEYNVHCPKVIDSWFWFHLFLNYLYLVALLNLKVSYAFMFCSLMKDKLKTICIFFLMIWTHVWLSLFHFHDLLFVFLFML
jgi:hypothetical protein